jgi:flagella basal body P-ring formation protein FlgA
MPRRAGWQLLLALVLWSGTAQAEVVVAQRTLRAQTVIGAEDVALAGGEVPGALISLAEAIGQETRVTVYAGRAIRIDDVGPPALVERNQIVLLSYRRGALSIVAEGRALARGGLGDSLRAMNLASRATVTGRVASDGTIVVLAQE